MIIYCRYGLFNELSEFSDIEFFINDHTDILQKYREAKIRNRLYQYFTRSKVELQAIAKISRIVWTFTQGIWAFFRIYIFKLSFLDGWQGFLTALSSFEVNFSRYAKLNERQNDWSRLPDKS